MSSSIDRVHFFERQYLRAYDLEAEQLYHIEMRRRLNIGLHTWGIVTGLDLRESETVPDIPKEFHISRGMAIDAYGRELVVPVDRPVHFRITASSVMNTFYVPALAGMIYGMPGMESELNAVINEAGVYDGFSANYSGAGFSHMRFKFHGRSDAEYQRWVNDVRGSSDALTRATYLETPDSAAASR